MNKFMNSIILMGVILSISACSYGQRAHNFKEAIKFSKVKVTIEAQIQYLVGQADRFIKSGHFDEAIGIAKHILSKLDPNSAQAKSIIKKAKAQLKNFLSRSSQI